MVGKKYEASKHKGGAMAPGTERKASDLWRWRRWVLLSGTTPTLFPYWGLFVITLPTLARNIRENVFRIQISVFFKDIFLFVAKVAIIPRKM